MNIKHILLIVGLILFTIATRFIHIDGLPQFNALLATAAFMGFVIKDTKWAVIAAVLMMIVSDMIFGSYGVMSTLMNYAGVVSIVIFTSRLKNYSAGNTLVASVIAPVLFFLISNLGVFLFSVPQLYPLTLDGFMHCYIMAVPFAKGTFIGTAVFSALYYVAHNKAVLPTLAYSRAKK